MAGVSTKEIKNRIRSMESTRQITKAMEMVAASKLRRAQAQVLNSRPYFQIFSDTIQGILASNRDFSSPELKSRPVAKVLYVVIAGDRGLAGGYNANVFRLLRELDENARITPIGKRACDKFSKEIVRAEGYSYEEAIALANELCKDFVEGNCNKVGIVCTKYNSMMSQEAQVKWILPLKKSEGRESVGAIFEPDEASVLNAIIPEYIAGVIISSVKESFASEVAARRVAMDSAGKNAQEMINNLELEYNRARQGAITQEITEIVAGSGI